MFELIGKSCGGSADGVLMQCFDFYLSTDTGLEGNYQHNDELENCPWALEGEPTCLFKAKALTVPSNAHFSAPDLGPMAGA